jgi:hypothetical protein
VSGTGSGCSSAKRAGDGSLGSPSLLSLASGSHSHSHSHSASRSGPHHHLKITGYQLVGLNWLYLLHRNQYNGVLADEMGLGPFLRALTHSIHFTYRQCRQERSSGIHTRVSCCH